MLQIVVRTVVVLACSLTPSAWGALMVDINSSGANNETTTQPGFIGVARPGATGLVTDIGTIDVAIARGPGSGTLQDRDRGLPATDPNQPLARLLRDFVYSQVAPHPNGAIDTTVTGLNPGTYLLTTYHHDTNVDHITNDLAISTDGGTIFETVVEDALISTGPNPLEAGRAWAPFTIGAGQSLVFRLIGDGGQVGATNDVETAVFSGFVIEPFTMFGDFNLDGEVTAADFFVLAGTLGTHLDGNFVGYAGGDMNLDGKVDLYDFDNFKVTFPAAFAAAMASNVPEPASIVVSLLAVGGLMGVGRYRQRSATSCR